MAPVIDLLAEAHSRPAVALEFLNSESRPAVEVAFLNDEIPRVGVAAKTWKSDAWSDLSWILLKHARHHLSEGNLDEAWQGFEIEWESLRRAQLRVTADSVDPITFSEESLREEIVKWGRHPNQSRDRILKAIRRLEAVAQPNIVRHEIHRQLVTSRALVEDYERWRRYVAWHFNVRPERYEFISWWMAWRMQPWERWRFQRSLRRQVFFAVAQADGLQRQLEAHQPLALNFLPDVSISIGPDLHERTLLEDTTLPPNMRGGFQIVVFNQFASRAEAFRATILRLALADWLREHGRYPRSLSELVPTYFAEVPLDPISAGEFVYFPRGVTDDVTNGQRDQQNVLYVKKKVPFLVTSRGIAGSWRRSQRQEGSWEFTNSEGTPLDLSSALRMARVWALEPMQSEHDQ